MIDLISAPTSAPLLALVPGQEGVILDLDRLISSRMLVQANSGGGKSHALRYLLEQTFGRVQHLVLRHSTARPWASALASRRAPAHSAII